MRTIDPPLAFAPPRVYVLAGIWEKPVAARRAERLCQACPGAEVRTYTHADLPDIVQTEGWDHFPKMGTLAQVPPPIPLLGLYEFDRARAQALEKRMREAYRGNGHFSWSAAAGGNPFAFFCSNSRNFSCQSLDQVRPNPEHVCRPQWRLHQGQGCPHQCAYCGLGGVLIIHVNTEEYITHLARLLERNPWQKTWLLDDVMDVPTLEPQLDSLAPLMRFFESTRDRYLIIHTKTDRAEGFLRARAPKNTIIAWSLSGPTQSRELEKVAGTTEGRIEAARVCQEAGIQVRFKFKPIVPVPDWRAEATYTIEQVFAHTRPDNLSMTVLMWMEVESLKGCIPERFLDPAFLRAAEEGRPEVTGTNLAPFPHARREEVYRYYLAEIRRLDPEIPVTISTESLEMWKSLGGALGFTPANYTCGCGAGAIPGNKKLATNPWQDAKAAVCWDGAPVFAENLASVET